MKIWIGGLLIIAILLAASYIWRDDYPWLQQWHQRLGMPAPPSVLDKGRTLSGKAVIYRWQDESGNWHFDSQPPQGREYERLLIDPDTNLLPGQ